MSEGEKKDDRLKSCESLGDAIMKVIEYHTMEYDMTYESVIGSLEMIKMTLYDELMEMRAEEDAEEDDA